MSKIGDLIKQYCPDGVEFRELGEIGTLYGGLSGKSKGDFTDGNARFITYVSIFNNIAINPSDTGFVKIGERERQTQVQFGDVLFTGSSETPDECGMSSVLTQQPDEPLYLNSFCFGFRPNNASLLLPDFSKYLFRDTTIRKQITKSASGVTRFNVSKKRFIKIKVPIPPIEVQQEIANTLDKFTQLTVELAAELAARKKQYEYYRNELLTFDEAGGVHWTTLGEVAMLKNGNDWKKLGTGDIPVYGSGGVMASVDKSAYSKPTVLIPRKGSITNIFYVDKPFWNVDTIYYTEISEKVAPKFFYYYMKTVDLMRLDTGSGRPSLTQAILNKIRVPVPSIAEQNRIVSILDKFDALVHDITEGLPAEIAAHRKQYEYYRNKLLTFQELPV